MGAEMTWLKDTLARLWQAGKLDDVQLAPVATLVSAMAAFIACIWLIVLLVVSTSSGSPYPVTVYAVSAVGFMAIFFARRFSTPAVTTYGLAGVMLLLAYQASADVVGLLGFGVGNLATGIAIALLTLASGFRVAFFALVVFEIGRAIVRIHAQDLDVLFVTSQAIEGTVASTAILITISALVEHVQGLKTDQNLVLDRLRNLREDQQQLFSLLLRETAEPISNLRHMLAAPRIDDGTRRDIHRIAGDLLQVIEGLDIAIAARGVPPLRYQSYNLTELAHDVERQVRQLMMLKEVRVPPFEIDLPINNYQLDVPRVRAILIGAPHTVYLLKRSTRELKVQIQGHRSSDDSHVIVLRFKLDRSSFSITQIRAAIRESITLSDSRTLGVQRYFAETKRYVSDLGGTIEAFPIGTKGGFELRISFPAEPAALPEIDESNTGSPSGLLAQKSVLLVDDDAIVRRASRQFLEQQFGAQVTAVSGGREALNELSGGKPYDLVITDFMMPDLSGADLIAQLHEQAPDLPVIAVTASGHNDDWETLRRAGADSVLTKPLTEDNLKQALDQLNKPSASVTQVTA